MGCKTLHSSSERTARPLQFEYGEQRAAETGWTMEVKTAYYSSVGIQMAWLVYSDEVRSVSTEFCGGSTTSLWRARHSQTGFTVLLDKSALSKDHSDPYRGKWGKTNKQTEGGHISLCTLSLPVALTLKPGGRGMLCPNALPLHIMSAPHSDRTMLTIPWCWNEWVNQVMKKDTGHEEHVCTLQIKEQRLRTQVKAPWNPDESEAHSRTVTLKWPWVWLALIS